MKNIEIYTDGSSRGNPGPGGWGAIIVMSEEKGIRVRELGGREDQTTNNRMELTALYEALMHIEKSIKKNQRIIIHSDSSYVLNGVTIWMYAWEKNGWKTKTKEDVLNKDIWEKILPLAFRLGKKCEVIFKKVAGHAGIYGNERADIIATGYADGERVLLYSGGISEYEKLLGGKLEDRNENVPVKKSKKSTSSKKAFSYVSLVDGKISVDDSWEKCEKKVKGKKGAKFQKVFSKQEENDLIGVWTLKSLF
jgi:ribonuclease HI